MTLSKELPIDYTEPEELIESVDYTDEEIAYKGYLSQRTEDAIEKRAINYTELDDMDYSTSYDENKRAANSYIRPKENPEDTRIVTGTTNEKSGTLLSALLNYNLEPNITAFDENNTIVNDIGSPMEDLVFKSREIEVYEQQRILIYKELLDQGTCFVEEVFVEEFSVDKTFKDVEMTWRENVDPAKIKWTERIEKAYGGCQTNLLQGKKVYLGNVREFEVQRQPYVIIREMIPYSEAKAIYGEWERFQYVPKSLVRITTDDVESNEDEEEYQEGFVDVVKYMDRYKNELMITLNAVMMLPVGFPLTYVSPSGDYPIAKGDVEPISKFFAYSKSIPCKTKVDQQVLDEMLRLMILKTQQSFKPPYANNTNRILSRDIFLPGNVINGIDPTKIGTIIDAKGVTQSEFAFFEMMKRLVDEKTVSPAFGGDATRRSQTATEVNELKKQQMMKLGQTIAGVINLERQLAWLRIYNIIQNWTKQIDTKVDEVRGRLEDVYQTFEIESTDDGKNTRKVIEFSPEGANLDTYQVQAEEDMMGVDKPYEVRKTYINPDVLRSVKYTWYVTINPTEKNSGELQRVLFTQNIQDAANIFGVETLNMEYLKERFAELAKEDYDKFFLQQTEQQPVPGQVPGQMPQLGGEVGAQLAGGIAQPSVTALSNA